MRRAHGVPARPRPHRPLEAVPAAEGEDTGLHRPRGRSLPHAHDPHARDDGDLARRRAGAAAERGSDRGDRARARHGPHTVRARRARMRSTTPCRSDSSRRFRHNEQSLRIARSLNLTHEVCDGILTHTGEREPEIARGKDRAARRPGRVHQPRHRRRRAVRAARRRRPAARGDRDPRRHGLEADRPARPRHRRVVGGRRRHPPVGGGGGGDAVAARLHVRARLPRPAGGARAREGARGHPRRSSTTSSSAATTPTRSSTTSPA